MPETRNWEIAMLTNDILGSKPYNLNLSEVKLDLTRGSGRPQWVLSTYGAARSTPGSLFEGNEFSPEEIRARFYEMASKGQELQADQEAIQLWQKAEQDMDNAAGHVDDVAKFMDEAEKKHPNRYDFLKTDGTKTREDIAKEAEQSNTPSSGFGTSSPFGQTSNNPNPFAKPAAATFGQPSGPSAFGGSAFGKPAQPSAFGQPAFGQSSFGSSPSTRQSNSGFGQSSSTSAFGQPAAASAFGKPAFGASAFGQSAFGQPAQPSSTPAFGQPAQTANQSPFGQASSTPAFGQSSFGQTAKSNPFGAPSASSGFGASTAFGQSSTPAFGQPSQAASPFGQSTQPTTAFGQPSQPGTGFGQSAFGQPAQPSAFGQSAFGQPSQPANSSPFGQAATSSSGFGTSNNNSNPFGQSLQPGASPFAKAEEPKINEISMEADASATAQSQSATQQNPFGTPQSSAFQNQTSTTPTNAAAPPPPPAQPSNNTSDTPLSLTSKPPKPLHYTQTLPSVPPQTNMSKRLISYRGQRVEYLGEDNNEVPCFNRPDGKGPEKIWFPEAGATQEVVALNREDKIADLQLDNDKYTDEVKREYAYLFEHGTFQGGKIPLAPPMREWCVYDF